MRSYKNIGGFDASILDDPMGMGEFDPGSKKFVWDKDHTDRMKGVENELNRLAAIEENAAE